MGGVEVLASAWVATAEVSAVVAIVAAVVGAAVTAYGVWERRRAFGLEQTALREQAEQYSRDLTEQRSRLAATIATEFLLEHFRARLTSYGPVFRSLGAVAQTGDGRVVVGGVLLGRAPDAYARMQEESRELIGQLARELFDHLYGEAGLLMNQETRDLVADARFACIDFLSVEGDPTAPAAGLVTAFYDARRGLRQDLQLFDSTRAQDLRRLLEQLA